MKEIKKCVACGEEMLDGSCIGRLCYHCIEKTVINYHLQCKKENINNYIFGIVDSVIYCNNNYNEGAARDLYMELLSDYQYERIIEVIKKIDCDKIDDFNSFYKKEIKKSEK